MSADRLYLLRHGEAGEGFPDSSRELVEAGRREVQLTLHQARPRISGPVSIYHSGLIRARQTAELAAEALGCSGISLLRGIDPAGDPANLCRQIEWPAGADQIWVTHNPFVEELVEWLSDEQLRIRTGSLVALELDYLDRGCARLLWQIN